MLIVLLFMVAVAGAWYETRNGLDTPRWTLTAPAKKGGTFSLYFMDKHIANVRGKTKAEVLVAAVNGTDMTDQLDM